MLIFLIVTINSYERLGKMSGNIEPIVQGQVLFDIGQSINKCFILQKGSIHIINSRDEKVGGIGPNTMFGFTELVKGESEHSTKAICVSSGTVVSFPSEIIKNKLEVYKEDSKSFLETSGCWDGGSGDQSRVLDAPLKCSFDVVSLFWIISIRL